LTEDEPLVSVVIPICNSEKTLARCLESIKNQTYKNIEVIIVDRNTTDRTSQIVKKHEAKFFQLDIERAGAKNFDWNESVAEMARVLQRL